MGLISLFLLALGLSMDAFAVSITNGMCHQNYGKKHAFATGLTFGGFQALMPVIGYFAARTFYQQIKTFDHWIAFILLGLIGGNMVISAIKDWNTPEQCPVTECPYSYKGLIIQGIATSIDALAVGVSFALLETNILVSALFIGVITFTCSYAGVFIGKKFGSWLKERAELAGGLILLGIGCKILIEHIIYLK